MTFRDLLAEAICDPITSGHVARLYCMILLEQIGIIGKPLGTIVLISSPRS